MGQFEILLAELARTRIDFESLDGNWLARAQAKDRLHARRSDIAQLRTVR